MGDNVNNMKLLILHTTILVSMTFVSLGQIIEFENPDFKSYLIKYTGIDANLDNEIDTSEAASFDKILDLSDANLASLPDIRHLTGIKGLDLSRNDITSIDVSMCKSLTYINLYDNRLTSIDVSGLLSLDTLNISRNSIGSIDVSNNVNLTYLNMYNNGVSVLNVGNNPMLTYLNCQNNNLSALDVSVNNLLLLLNFGANSLTEIDVSNIYGLEHFTCNWNKITNLDVSNNPSLTFLDCSSNGLENLDLRNGGNIYMPANLNTTNNFLMCISVDNEDWANATWSNKKDVGTKFSEDCTVGIQEVEFNQHSKDVTIYDFLGRVINKPTRNRVYIFRDTNGRTVKEAYR